MFVSGNQTARARYLQALLAHYGTIAIPIGSREQQISLETVFQPLALRHRSLAPVEDERSSQADGATQQIPEDQQSSQEQTVVARDGAEALQKSSVRRLLILGGPGMGKTTLLKALLQQAIALALANPDAPLPLFISLSDLGRSGLSLIDYVPQLLAELEIEAAFAASLSAAITGGQAFLCLDSLDEVLPAQRPDIIALINRLAPRYGGTWIIGSRFTEYQDGQFSAGRFAEWELLPLDDILRRQLADHLLPLLSNLFQMPLYSSEIFLQALAKDRHIAEWGDNPLLFSLASVAYARQGNLPASRAALYATIIDTMLGLRVADPSASRVLRKQLARLALDLYQTKGRNFTAQNLRELLTAYEDASDAKKLYAQLALVLDSGVFDVVAYQTYGFKHQMFQEYLAAVALAEQLLASDEQIAQAAWDFIERKRTYSRWREILRLLVGVLVEEHGVGGSRMAAQWLQHLANLHTTEEGDPGYLCLVLALSSLQEFPARAYTPSLAQAIRALLMIWAEKLFEAMAAGTGSYYFENEQQNNARTDAGRIFDRLKQLLERIQMLDLPLVLPALSALERAFERAKSLGVDDKVDKQFETLLDDLALSIPARVLDLAFPEPGNINLHTIITTEKPELVIAVEPLIALLETQSEAWRVRVGVARLLSRSNAAIAQQALSQALVDTTCSYRVRVVAAEMLGWRGGVEAATVLSQVAHDSDERVRIAVVKAMGQLGAEMPVQLLLAALRYTRLAPLQYIDEVRTTAIAALGQLDEQASLDPLLLSINNDDPYVREGVLCALRIIQERSVRVPIEVVMHSLRDAHYRVRSVALFALGSFADIRALSPLLEALNDDTSNPWPSRDPASAAVEALLKLSQKMPDLRQWITAEHLDKAFSNERLQDGQLFELAHALHIQLSLTTLFANLARPQSVTVLEQVIQQFTSMGTEVPIDRLLKQLHAYSTNIQRNAALVLLRLYQHVPVEPIIEWIENVDLQSDIYSFEERHTLAETYIYLSELLARQGKDVSMEVLFSILKNAGQGDALAEGFASICSVLPAKAPVARLFGMLCDEIQAEQCVHILDNCNALLTPELIRAEASHRYKDEITAIEVLEAMQGEAPLDLLMAILKDEGKNKFVRVHALYTLHDLGVAVPLEYFMLGQDWCIYGVDDDMIENMTRLGAQAPIPELVELLGYGNNWVGTSAVRSLRNLAEYVPVDLMLTALESKNQHMREAAAAALGTFGERAPVGKLLAMISDKRERLHVRAAALDTLTSVGFRVPIDLLLRLVQLDDQSLRRAVFEAFAALGKDAPLDVLLRLMDEGAFHYEIAEVFGSMAENAPVDLLLSFLDGDDNAVQSAAAHALAKLEKYAPVEKMIARLFDKDGEMRQDLIDAFGKMGEYAPIDVILKALDNDNSEIRGDADTALYFLSESAPTKLVAELRDDPRPVVRKRVLDALIKMGKDAPIEIALAALDEKETRADALYTLAELDRDISSSIEIEMLLQILSTDEDSKSHWRVLKILEQFGEQVPVELLLPLLGDTANASAAAKTLYKTHPAVFREMVAPQAETILRGEPVGGVFASLVQSRIATVVGQIGRATPEVLNMVVDLLDWPYAQTRLEAARALGAIHRNIPDRAIRRLMELRHDSQSFTVRKAADVALAEILSYENGMEEEA